MDNIEIKRAPAKKSMQSLLEQSAIDNQFNYQAQQLRQAYNKTIKDLNIKITQHEKYIQKLEQEIKDKNKEIRECQDMLEANQEKLQAVEVENGELKNTNAMISKRLYQVEYKLETIEKNRKLIPQMELDDDQGEYQLKRLEDAKNNARKQVYKEIAEILNAKIGKFVKQIKNYPMNAELQQSIQAFLQQIIYINSNESKQKLFETKADQDQRQRKIGKISARRHQIATQKLADMQEWKQMQKSLNKLKKAGGIHSNSPTNRKLQYGRNIETKNKYQFSTMSTKPLINYI